MTARGAPAGNGAGAPREGAGGVEAAGGGYDVAKIPQAPDTTREPVHVSQCVAEFVDTLLDLGRTYGDIPLYGSPEWAALDPLDPRKFASVVRAAEFWRRDGEPDRMRNRLLDELEVADLMARWRVRMAGHDVRGDTDWCRVLDVVMARRAVA